MSQSDDDDDRSSSSSWSDDESSLDTRSNDESSWRSDSEYEPSSESGSDYESSCCSESSCDSGSSKEKAALSDQELNAHCHIPLPIEVWECILLHLHEKDLLRMRKVSKLHRSITQSTAFQSRYLLKCYSKCEAIYEATCRPKLFNGQLLRGLLGMGAIMSRHFVQCLNMFYMQRKESDLRWTRRLTVEAYTSVIVEGVRLYGETLNLCLDLEDFNKVFEWTRHSNPSEVYKGRVRKILEDGKFAPFAELDGYYCGRYFALKMINVRPELIQVLRRNGFEWENNELDSFVDDSFRDHQSDPEALYQRIKSVIDTSPAWKPSAVSFKNLITGNERLGRDVISANIEQINEVGPIPAQMSVVKRIYEEGRGFQDLKKQLFLFINHDRLDENKIPFSVRVYRVLYYSFAPLMQEVRELIGAAYVQVWKHKQKSDPSSPELSSSDQDMMKQCLFHRLKELDLTPFQIARIFSLKQITPTMIVPALEAGLFGQDWVDDLGSIARPFIDFCLRDPMNGKQLRQLSDIFSSCNGLQYQDTTVTVDETFFADQLHTVLSSWSINLDRLLPDLISNTKLHLRSPIGWMVKSTILKRVDHVQKKHTTADLADPYWLINDISTKKDANLTFTITSAAIDLPFLQEPIDGIVAAETGDSIQGERLEGSTTINDQAGWKHLGRIDPATGVISPSSQAYNTNNEDDIETESDSVFAMSDDESSLDSKVTVDEEMPYPTFNLSIEHWVSGSSSFGTSTAIKGREDQEDQEEAFQVIIEMLGRDSLVIRDVVLAHALANGNAELAEELTNGNYYPIDTDPSSRPVLPTFSHLLIWQRLRRRPLKIYLDCILRGAPFRQGNVKSTLYPNNSISLEGRERYSEEGYDDDERMVSLFDHKMALQKNDAIIPEDQLNDCSKMLLGSDKMDSDSMQRVSSEANISITSENQDHSFSCEVDEQLDPQKGILLLQEEVHVVYDGYQRSLTLKELIRQKESLSMWKDHLEALLWIEEREMRIFDRDVRRYEEPSDPMKSFLIGLKEMIKKVDDMSVIIQRHLSEQIEKSMKAVGEMGTIRLDEERGTAMSSRCTGEDNADEEEKCVGMI